MNRIRLIAVLLLAVSASVVRAQDGEDCTDKEWRAPRIFAEDFTERFAKKAKLGGEQKEGVAKALTGHRKGFLKDQEELRVLGEKIEALRVEIDRKAEAARKDLVGRVSPKQAKKLKGMLRPGMFQKFIDATAIMHKNDPADRDPDAYDNVQGIDMNYD